MWYLEKVEEKTLEEYTNKLNKGLKKRINSSTLSDDQKKIFLEKDVIKELLTKEPKALYDLHKELMPRLIPGYDNKELPIYENAKRKEQGNRDEEGKRLVNKYSILETLSKTFDYNGAISKKKEVSYWITKKKGQNVCTYCNRQYVFTVENNENSNKKMARPELDHWFPKELYPIMSLSFYNLIPCCKLCNSSAKGSSLFNFDTHIHPYCNNKPNPEFKFGYMPNPNGTWSVDFIKLNGKEENMVEGFCLKEMYHCHDEYEITEILNLATKNNGTYLQNLLHTILHDFSPMNIEEVYRMLFGTEYLPQNQDKRPLSKLKYDLISAVEDSYGIKIL